MLIFSQMTKMLDLLHYYLEERGFDPCRIDGSISWEERMVRMSAGTWDHHIQKHDVHTGMSLRRIAPTMTLRWNQTICNRHKEQS